MAETMLAAKPDKKVSTQKRKRKLELQDDGRYDNSDAKAFLVVAMVQTVRAGTTASRQFNTA